MRLAEVLGQFVGQFSQPELIRGIVKDVNKQKMTCTVEPFNGGADFVDVKLTAGEGRNENSVVVVPVIFSVVYVGIIDGDSRDTFLAKTTDVREIIFMGGENGGLCITPELIKQLNRMSARIDRLESAINGGKPATGAPDSGAALSTSMKSVLSAALIAEDFGEIENKKIKH